MRDARADKAQLARERKAAKRRLGGLLTKVDREGMRPDTATAIEEAEAHLDSINRAALSRQATIDRERWMSDQRPTELPASKNADREVLIGEIVDELITALRLNCWELGNISRYDQLVIEKLLADALPLLNINIDPNSLKRQYVPRALAAWDLSKGLGYRALRDA